MSQNYIKIGSSTSDMKIIHQPVSGMQWDFETTYTSDSNRSKSGIGYFTEMFTVQSYSYDGKDLTVEDMSQILQLIVGKQYYLQAFSPYSGKWETLKCYTGQGSLNISTLKESDETYESLSFNAVAIKPLEV